jgi:hypothetical protein
MAAEYAPAAYFLFCTVKHDGAHEPERIRGPVVTADQSLPVAAKRFVDATLLRERLSGTDAQPQPHEQEGHIKLQLFLFSCADPEARFGPRGLLVSFRVPSLELIFECHRADVFDRYEEIDKKRAQR